MAKNGDNESLPIALISHDARKATGFQPSAFSGTPTSRTLFLLDLFSRSSTLLSRAAISCACDCIALDMGGSWSSTVLTLFSASLTLSLICRISCLATYM